MEVLDRVKEPTPKFWRKIRKYCITIGAISGAIMAAPVALPAAVISLAGYGLTIGAVGASLATLTKEDKK